MDAETTRWLEQMLAAVAPDGHGVIVRTSGERLAERGDPAVCAVLARIAVLGTTPTEVTTEWLSGGLVACGQQRCGIALVIALSENVSTMRVHTQLSNAVAMLASLTPPASPPGGPNGDGESGAPSELSITEKAKRPN